MLPRRDSPTQDFFGNELKVGDWIWIVDSNDQPSIYSGVTSREISLAKIQEVKEYNDIDVIFKIERYITNEYTRVQSPGLSCANIMTHEKVLASEVFKADANYEASLQPDMLEEKRFKQLNNSSISEFNEDLL
jgi:hypothetical protein